MTSAERDIVQAFLVSVLAEDKKLLLRFRNMVNKCATKEDVEDYFEQIDEIADRYLGRDHFINYYQAYDFMLELEEIIDKDVRRMIDNGSHISAFHVMNHIFVLLGNVDMDDSGGETSMLAEQIYQLWLELLTKVNAQDKGKCLSGLPRIWMVLLSIIWKNISNRSLWKNLRNRSTSRINFLLWRK